MKESIKNIPDATQLDMNFHSDTKNDVVTHLFSQDDLDELATIDPVTHEAIMAEIEQQRESIEQQQKLEDIDRRATEVEKAEALEITKKREDELRASIAKAYNNGIADETNEDIETGSGDIYDSVKYAKIIEEQIKAKEEKRRKWWQSKRGHRN